MLFALSAYMKHKIKIIGLILAALCLLSPQKLYALDVLKSIKESAVELGETLLQKGKKLPKTIAVLPATGEGEEQDKAEIRTTFSNHISYKNYEQIKITDVDEKLHLAKKETGKNFNELSPQELGKILNVDGLIYVHVVGIEKVYAALYASLTLKLKVKLVNAENGETIWEKEDSVTERSGGVPTSPWGAISTAVSSALVLRESVKIALTDKLCRSLAKEMPEPKVAKAKKPPVIFSVVSNALDSPFKAQDEILVSLRGQEGLTAYFNIGDVKKAIQLAEINPGEYVGKYVVTDGDNLKNKTITAYLYNSKDRLESQYTIPYAITMDTTPPAPISDLKISMVKEGFNIFWKQPNEDDLKDFVIQKASVDSPEFTELAATSVPEYTDTDITFGKKYYYRVFARDKANNMSKYVEIVKTAVKQGPTYITGEVKENTIFYEAGSPYIIKGSVVVQKGASITVEEGAVVEFEKDSQLVVSGKLFINGKKEANITFKGSEYSIILKDTTKDAMKAEHAYFLGGKRFVISNASALFSNTIFEDFNTALIIERNSVVELKDSVFRKNKLGIKVTDSDINFNNTEISQSDKAIELYGNTKIKAQGIKLLNNNLHLFSENLVELREMEISEKQELDVIKKIRGNVDISRIVPFGKSFRILKKEAIDDIKKELSFALLKNNHAEAKAKIKLIEELSPKDFYDISDVAAYVYFYNGNVEKAKDILAKGASKSPKELEKFFSEQDKSNISVLFTDVKVALGQTLDGVDRAAVTKAKWRAVKMFTEEKVANIDREKLSVINDKIIPKSNDYILNVVTIYTETGDVRYDGYYMVFLDSKRLLDDLKENRLLGDVLMETKFAVVDCTGLGMTKQYVAKTLQRFNFIYSDYGTGSCDPSQYYDRAKTKEIDVIVTITESAKVSPSLLGGNLKNIQANLDIKGYDVFLSKPLFSLTKGANVYHMNDETGKEIAIKSAIDSVSERFEREILSLEKTFSSDEARKKVKKAFFAEKFLPPVEVKVTKAESVFANNYKVYGEKPFTEVVVSNNTSGVLEKLKVTFMVKNYMDFPSETVIEKVEPLSSKTVNMSAIFNNRLLELTENSTLLADVSVKYVKNGNEKEVNVTHPIQVFEKHALIWDDRAKIAIYATPKDPAIVDFSREISRNIKEKIFSTSFSLGVAVFEAIRSIGTIYQQDPNNPYQLVSEKSGTVDYVQYARETLKRKAGDCDDLVSLFISVMESLGIKTAAIDYPGHILAMFDTGISKEDLEKYGFKRDMVIIYEDNVFIPVELTLLGESFYRAWQKGAANYYENLGRGLKIISMEKAWQTYKPATLPMEGHSFAVPSNFKGFYEDSLKVVAGMRNEEVYKMVTSNQIKPEQAVYLAQKTSSLDDSIMLGRFLVQKGVVQPLFLNDLGNVLFKAKKYEEAVQYYKMALEKSEDNPFIMNNLMEAYKQAGRKNDAKMLRERIKILAPFLLED